MVRLKEIAVVLHHVLKAFQFHYGTIKSLLEDQTGTLHVEFQFHYGTIKSLFVFLVVYLSYISIPLWYD